MYNRLHTHTLSGDVSQLHLRCKKADKPLAMYLPTHGKKWFAKDKLYCAFCQKKGHTMVFCPLRPTVVSKDKELPFVQKLLSTPKVKPQTFFGMTKQEALKKITEEGRALNSDNP